MLNNMTANNKLSFAGCIIVGVLLQIFVSDALNFNLKTHICCNGTVTEKGKHTECCGNQAFNSSLAACCGDQVISFQESPEDRLHHGCCYASSGVAKQFNTRTHQCCDGRPLEKADKDHLYNCCAGQLFNASSHICCDEKLLDRTSGNDCCGGKVYSNSRQICCQKSGLVGDAMALEYSDILDRKGVGSFCCGRAVYDSNKTVCCNDKVLPKPDSITDDDAGCCEGQVMDHQNQLCCRSFCKAAEDGKLRNKTGTESSCCGSEVFDFHDEVCCNETRFPKPKGMDKETYGACCGDKVMTSFEFQLCHDGRLIERKGFDMWPCGEDGLLFNTTTQNCCFGNVLENGGDEGCCYSASRPFDTKTEICCGEELVSLTEEDIIGQKFACCTPFHYHTQDHDVTSKQ